jgi:hypothetical protein
VSSTQIHRGNLHALINVRRSSMWRLIRCGQRRGGTASPATLKHVASTALRRRNQQLVRGSDHRDGMRRDVSDRTCTASVRESRGTCKLVVPAAYVGHPDARRRSTSNGSDHAGFRAIDALGAAWLRRPVPGRFDQEYATERRRRNHDPRAPTSDRGPLASPAPRSHRARQALRLTRGSSRPTLARTRPLRVAA